MLKRDRVADEPATLYLLKEYVNKKIEGVAGTNASLKDLVAVRETLNDCKTAIEFMNSKIDEVLEYRDRGAVIIQGSFPIKLVIHWQTSNFLITY